MENKVITAKREGCFTASNIYKLLTQPRSKSETISQTAKSYIDEVVAEIVTGMQQEEIFSHALDWGKCHEPQAVEEYEKVFMTKGTYYGGAEPTFFKFEDMPLGCSPDYVTETEIVEFKCPFNSVRHVECIGQDEEWLKKERKEYYAQMQLQMLIMNKEAGYFASFDPRMLDENLRIYRIRVNVDKEFQQKILDAVANATEYMQKRIDKITEYKESLYPF